jgi:hypothetical protein
MSLTKATYSMISGACYNVLDFGADNTAVNDSATAINTAITTALAANGGTIYFPAGTYKILSTIVVPQSTNIAVYLVGDGMRETNLALAANVGIGIRWGSDTRDASGTYDKVSLYGGMRNICVTANAIASTNTLFQGIELQNFEMTNVLLQKANGVGGTGLKLLGSLTSGGYGAGGSPHFWRGKFYNVRVDDCRVPVYMENADENDFTACTFSATKSLTTGTNSIRVITLAQGVDNRFYGTLITGDVSGASANYLGVYMPAVTNGLNQLNQFYGLVAEGFNYGIYVYDSTIIGATFEGYYSSINVNAYYNPSGSNGTRIFSAVNDINFYARRQIYTPTQAVSLSGSSILTGNTEGNVFTVNVTTSTAYTVDPPSSPVDGQFLTYIFKNTSGGAMGTLSWNAIFKLCGSLTNPATGNQRMIQFYYDGTNWRETWRSVADQPN